MTERKLPSCCVWTIQNASMQRVDEAINPASSPRLDHPDVVSVRLLICVNTCWYRIRCGRTTSVIGHLPSKSFPIISSSGRNSPGLRFQLGRWSPIEVDGSG